MHLLPQSLLPWSLPLTAHASSSRFVPYIPGFSHPPSAQVIPAPLEHIPSMSSWLSLAQASRFKLKVASSVAPFLCMGEPANTFPHALPCNAFTVTLIMSCGIMLSVSSSRIQALWGRVCIQMNQPWLEVGSPKLPYPQDPEVLSSLSTCLPGWDREAPAWEGCSGTKDQECPSLEEAFGGICLPHHHLLLSKLLSRPEADQFP